MLNDFNNLFKYRLIYSKKRKTTITFKIVDSIVNIYLPLKTNLNYIQKLLIKRQGWIIYQLRKKEHNNNIIQDDKILYLGNEINIITIKNHLLSKGGFCELVDNKLYLYICNNFNNETKQKIIKKKYKKQSLQILTERIKYFSEKYNFKYGKISIKERKTVWGTCNTKNDLVFNWKILAFNYDVIDYLVVHELSHTIHKNHSKDFWNTVQSILPNYKNLRNILKTTFN